MHTNVSDLIERFLLDTLGDNPTLQISRNDLAQYFAVAPSQINYVLATRFTLDRGFQVESRRGGGGYVLIRRLDEDDYVTDLVTSSVGDEISYARTCQILERLTKDDVISQETCDMMKAVLSQKCFALPQPGLADTLRATQLKAFLVTLLKTDEKEKKK